MSFVIKSKQKQSVYVLEEGPFLVCVFPVSNSYLSEFDDFVMIIHSKQSSCKQTLVL